MTKTYDKSFGGYGLKYKKFTDDDVFPLIWLKQEPNDKRIYFETLLEKKELSNLMLKKILAYLTDSDYLPRCLKLLNDRDYERIHDFLVLFLKWTVNFIQKHSLCFPPVSADNVNIRSSAPILERLNNVIAKCVLSVQAFEQHVYSQNLQSPFIHNKIYKITHHVTTNFEKLFKRTIWKDWD